MTKVNIKNIKIGTHVIFDCGFEAIITNIDYNKNKTFLYFDNFDNAIEYDFNGKIIGYITMNHMLNIKQILESDDVLKQILKEAIINKTKKIDYYINKFREK